MGHRHQLHRRRDRHGLVGLPTKMPSTREGDDQGDVRRWTRQVRVTSFGHKVTTSGISVTIRSGHHSGRVLVATFRVTTDHVASSWMSPNEVPGVTMRVTLVRTMNIHSSLLLDRRSENRCSALNAN
jgi:hypothetical protein